MTFADAALARPNGRAEDFSNVLSRVREKVSWPPAKRLESLARAPRLSVGPSDKKMNLATDRVRAAPAISPTLSMNLGMTAIGLGIWGTLFPRHVARTLGIDAPAPVVQGVFGLRELWTGFALAGDPTKSGMLWARVAGDVFDIAVLKSLDNRRNPQRGVARAALGFVLAATALDVFTAVRMSNVKRNCE